MLEISSASFHNINNNYTSILIIEENACSRWNVVKNRNSQCCSNNMKADDA